MNVPFRVRRQSPNRKGSQDLTVANLTEVRTVFARGELHVCVGRPKHRVRAV